MCGTVVFGRIICLALFAARGVLFFLFKGLVQQLSIFSIKNETIFVGTFLIRKIRINLYLDKSLAYTLKRTHKKIPHGSNIWSNPCARRILFLLLALCGHLKNCMSHLIIKKKKKK